MISLCYVQVFRGSWCVLLCVLLVVVFSAIVVPVLLSKSPCLHANVWLVVVVEQVLLVYITTNCFMGINYFLILFSSTRSSSVNSVVGSERI